MASILLFPGHFNSSFFFRILIRLSLAQRWGILKHSLSRSIFPLFAEFAQIPPWCVLFNLPANEGGGERSYCVYYLTCKYHFQGSGALTCESKISMFPLKCDCCSLVQWFTTLLKTSGIDSLGSWKAIEQRGFLIHHNYTNTCTEQPCTELPSFFFSCTPMLNTPHLQFGGLMAEHRMQ